MDALPRSVGFPSFGVLVDGRPRRQVVREHAPRASRARDVDDGVDDFAQVGARSAAPFGGRKHGFDEFPLRVREVGVVRLSFHNDTIIASFRILDTAS